MGAIKTINLLNPNRSLYFALNVFTQGILEGFEKEGITCRLIHTDSPEEIRQLIEHPADLTFAFNGVLPGEGKTLFDVTGKPHVAYLVDSPHRFLPLLDCPQTSTVCVDEAHQQFALNFTKDAFFLPHAIDSTREYQDRKKKYEIVMPMSFVDPLPIQKSWKKRFSKYLYESLHQAVGLTLADATTSFYQAFMNALTANLPLKKEEEQYTAEELLSELEMVIRGLAQIKVLEALKHFSVDLFGDNLDACPITSSHHRRHKEKNFVDMLTIFEQSKVVINSSPKMKQGGHERIFEAFACYALPATDLNSFLPRHFDTILYYQFTDFAPFQERLHHYLTHEEERKAAVEAGRREVFKNFTWHERAKAILKMGT